MKSRPGYARPSPSPSHLPPGRRVRAMKTYFEASGYSYRPPVVVARSGRPRPRRAQVPREDVGRLQLSEPKCFVQGGPPDVVILGCASVKREERRLIQDILAHKRPPGDLVRGLLGRTPGSCFRAGAGGRDRQAVLAGSLMRIVGRAFAGRRRVTASAKGC